MNTVTLAELLDAVASQLETVLVPATSVPIHITAGLFRAADLPAINVYPASRALTQELAGFDDLYGGWPLAIRVAVSPADIEAGEALLWAFMDDGPDPLSIIAALDSDHSLSGAAQDLVWGDWFGYQDFSTLDEPGSYIGSTLPMLVMKAKAPTT